MYHKPYLLPKGIHYMHIPSLIHYVYVYRHTCVYGVCMCICAYTYEGTWGLKRSLNIIFSNQWILQNRKQRTKVIKWLCQCSIACKVINTVRVSLSSPHPVYLSLHHFSSMISPIMWFKMICSTIPLEWTSWTISLHFLSQVSSCLFIHAFYDSVISIFSFTVYPSPLNIPISSGSYFQGFFYIDMVKSPLPMEKKNREVIILLSSLIHHCFHQTKDHQKRGYPPHHTSLYLHMDITLKFTYYFLITHSFHLLSTMNTQERVTITGSWVNGVIKS